MKVKQMARHALSGLVAVDASDSLAVAAQRMVEEEVGAVVVFAATGIRGVFSERDLLRAVGDEADLTLGTVLDYMTESPVTVDSEAPTTDVVAKMNEYGTRHLVVTEDGQVTGMVSVRDVLSLVAAHRAEI